MCDSLGLDGSCLRARAGVAVGAVGRSDDAFICCCRLLVGVADAAAMAHLSKALEVNKTLTSLHFRGG